MTADPSDRLALIADIHGNRWALDAVLDDLARRGSPPVVNLGDSLYGSLDPAGTARRLRELGIPSLAGNQDRIVVDPPAEVADTADQRFVLSQLSPDDLDWLARMPPTIAVGEIFCCHGTPGSDESYLLEEVTPSGVSLRPGEAIAADCAGIDRPVLACGHSHVPRVVHLPGGRLAVNPGSVGLPAYTHDLPYPHAMESGSPHARYALLERRAHGWSVELVAVAYPWAEAAATARRNGRPDRARWIETGRA
jgi:predicted phosphodiesterase